MMSFLLLWVFFPHPQTAASDSSNFAVSITTQSMPNSLGTPRLVVDGVPSSILPALIEISLPPGETRKVDIWGDELQHYSFSLVRSATGVQLSQYVDSCQKERATPAFTANGHTINVVMTFRIDRANCSSSAATTLPNARIKIRFQSLPQDAILYFQNSSAFTSSALPAVLSLGYSTGMRLAPFTVYFKKTGYYDCAKNFKLVQANGAYQLEVDAKQVSVSPGDVPDASAPVIACELKKVP
jgi:hypothetical protein